MELATYDLAAKRRFELAAERRFELRGLDAHLSFLYLRKAARIETYLREAATAMLAIEGAMADITSTVLLLDAPETISTARYAPRGRARAGAVRHPRHVNESSVAAPRRSYHLVADGDLRRPPLANRTWAAARPCHRHRSWARPDGARDLAGVRDLARLLAPLNYTAEMARLVALAVGDRDHGAHLNHTSAGLVPRNPGVEARELVAISVAARDLVAISAPLRPRCTRKGLRALPPPPRPLGLLPPPPLRALARAVDVGRAPASPRAPSLPRSHAASLTPLSLPAPASLLHLPSPRASTKRFGGATSRTERIGGSSGRATTKRAQARVKAQLEALETALARREKEVRSTCRWRHARARTEFCTHTP